MPYAAYQIAVTAEEDLEANIVLLGTTLADTVLVVYCDPFDPANPLQRVYGYDDDDGEGFHAAFTAADGVTLDPGETYWITIGDRGALFVNRSARSRPKAARNSVIASKSLPPSQSE